MAHRHHHRGHHHHHHRGHHHHGSGLGTALAVGAAVGIASSLGSQPRRVPARPAVYAAPPPPQPQLQPQLQPQPQPGHQLVSVQCPAGVGPGQQVLVQCGDGRQMAVMVPQGVVPGQTFMCQVPLASSAAAPPAAFAAAVPSPAPVPTTVPSPAPAPAQPQLVFAEAVVEPQQMMPPALNPELDPGYDPMAKSSAAGAASASPPPAVVTAGSAVAPPLQSHPPPVGGGGPVTTCEMSGWLTKLGEVRKTWKRRWFVLRAGVVHYKENDSAASTLGSFQCSDVSAVFAQIDETVGGQSVFHVTTPSRTFVLQAGSLMEQTRWIDALRAATAATHQPRMHGIWVEQASPTIKAGTPKFVFFAFDVHIHGTTYQRAISGRYSDLRATHDTLCLDPPRGIGLQRQFPGGGLEFPSKTSWFTDDVEPSSIAHRNSELAAYYNQLLDGDDSGTVLCAPLVHQLFAFQQPLVQQLNELGVTRAQAKQAAEAAAQQAAADARALLVADQQTAQLVQQLPCPMGSAAPLVYPHKQMSFRLRNKIFSFGGRMARPAQHMKSIPPRILHLIERWQM